MNPSFPSVGQPIVVSQLVKRYPQETQPALRGVSFTVPAGQQLALMGPSGCGKSTLLNVLGAMDRPTAGEVIVGQQVIHTLNDTDQTRFRAETIGFVFQFFNLLPTLTVIENVCLPLQLADRAAQPPQQHRALALAMLADVGMADFAHRLPAQLSGGQMQRVAIARALVHRPGLVLADEPTGNLDSHTSESVLALLTNTCRAHGMTLLMVTHSAEVAQACQRILVLRDGQVVSDTLATEAA